MPVVDGLPMTELRRQVSPRRAGSGPPEHSVEHLPVIGPPATTARREVGQQQRHPVPLGIGQIVTIEHIPCLPQPGYKIHGTGSNPYRNESTGPGAVPAADRWTWLVIAAHTQLRLARPLA